MKLYEVKITQSYVIEAPSEEHALMKYHETEYLTPLFKEPHEEVSEYLEEVTE